MKSELPDHLQSIVDSVCEQGCAEVNHVITDLQQGKSDKLSSSLNNDEKQIVLRELQCIMSVYNQQQ